MKRQSEIAFGITIVCLSVTILIGLGGADGIHATARILIVPLLICAGGLFVLKRRKPTQRGLMNAKPRPPLSASEREEMAARFMTFVLSTKIQADNETPVVQPLSDELVRLTQLWKAQSGGKPLSDNEMRSLDILTRFVTPFYDSRIPDHERDKALLNDIADPAYFFELRERVLAWEAQQPKVGA